MQLLSICTYASTRRRSQTPVRVKHWFTLSVFFSVWDEDLRGQPLNRKQHGHLREGKLRLKTAITHVSSTSAHHPKRALTFTRYSAAAR
jgi:hypothetical protein